MTVHHTASATPCALIASQPTHEVNPTRSGTHHGLRPLTMTAARRGAFARVAAQRFDRHEAQLIPAIEAALGDWLDLALRATLPELTAAAEPDPAPRPFTAGHADAIVAQLRRLGPRFAAMLDRHVMPAYRRMLDEILAAGLSDTRTAAALIVWRRRWLAARRQALVNIPDDVTTQLRTGLIGLAHKDGTNVDDAQRLAQQMLNRGYPSWSGRARLIARTETVGANNQGSLASWTSLAQAAGQPGTKTWMATSDAHTRPDHAEADGKTVGLHEKFTVGDVEMNGPGDPDAGPGQVCNCRCTLTYDFPGGDPSMTAAATDPTDDAAPADDDTPTGVAIMLGVGAGDEAAILGAPGVPVPPPPGLHCTVGYLDGQAADYSDEQKAALLSRLAGLAPEGTAEAFATAHFNPDSDEREPCAVLLVQSLWLADLHDAVTAAVGDAGLPLSTTFPTWIPHVAVAYGADPSIIPDTALGELSFNRLVVGWAGEQHVVAGDGAEQLTAAVDPAPDDGAVTAPAAPADTAPAATPAPTDAPEATGGDTGTTDLTPQGITWSGPIARLDYNSDGRVIAAAGGVVRPLPLPLSWQRESGMDHDDSVIVGRMLAAEVRTDPALGPVLWATGDYLDPMVNFDVQQAMAQVDAGLGLVSVDLAITAFGYADSEGNPLDPALNPPADGFVEVATGWELGGVTLVSFPAFGDVRIHNDPLPDEAAQEPDAMMPAPGPVSTAAFSAANPAAPTISDDAATITLSDGSTVGVGDLVGIPDYDNDGDDETGTITAINGETESVTVSPTPDDGEPPSPDMEFPVAQLVAAAPAPPATADGDAADGSALTAAVAVRPYTAAFFRRPEADGPTPLTIDPETGEVFGHLAEYGTCHVGKLAESGACVTAPHSERDYSDFHLSPVLTDEGPLDVGRLTVGTGHAAPGGGFANAVAHYDNTGTQVALARAIDGEHGIWLSGQLIHDAPAAKVEELMRSPLSGDWRARNGHLELCAALAVNVPGFPVKRPTPIVGQRQGVGQLSLVAAGVVMRGEHTVRDGEITLPSGATITRTDLEALVAAASDALRSGAPVTPANTEADELALRRARARLRLRTA